MDKTKKSRPLSVDVSLVSSVLDERKTMTRRPVKVRHTSASFHHLDVLGRAVFTDNSVIPCPFGVAGDGLWLRERARVLEVGAASAPAMHIRYEADGAEAWVDYPARLKTVEVGRCIANGVHREGSRWTGIITEVRVERIEDITEADAVAEGVEPVDDPFQEDNEYWRCYRTNCEGRGGECAGVLSARESFETLWQRLYPGSWERNDWVWVVRWGKPGKGAE